MLLFLIGLPVSVFSYVVSSDPWYLLLLPGIVALGLVTRRYSVLPRQLRGLQAGVPFTERDAKLTRQGCTFSYTSGMQSFIPWALFKKADFRDGIYILTIPGGLNYYLPRRVLTDDQEHYLVDRLREAKLMP